MLTAGLILVSARRALRIHLCEAVHFGAGAFSFPGRRRKIGTRWFAAVMFGLLILGCAHFADSALPADQGDTAVFLIDRTYPVEKFSPIFAEAFVNAAPLRWEKLRDGESLEPAIKRLLGLTPRAHPTIYDAVLLRILREMALTDARQLRSGAVIRLPDIPPVYVARGSKGQSSRQSASSGKSSYQSSDSQLRKTKSESALPEGNPINVLAGSLARAETSTQEYESTPPKSSDNLLVQVMRTGSWRYEGRFVVVTLDATTPSALEAFRMAPIKNSVATASRAVPSAATPHPAYGAPELSNEISILKSLSGNHPQPRIRPVLLILDDSWPSNDALVKAYAFVAANLSALKRDIDLPPDTFADTFPNPPTEFVVNTETGATPHAVTIDEAIRDFADALPGMVDVVYLPLTWANDGAKELMSEIVFTYVMKIARDEDVPTDELVDHARASTASLLSKGDKQIKKTLTFSVPTITFEAVVWMASRIGGSIQNARPTFINVSWTVPSSQTLERARTTPGSWLIVAAAGNDCDACQEDLYSHPYYPARWAMEESSTVTVIDTKRDGTPLCSSNLPPVSQGDRIRERFLAIDGRTRDNCGTSFAAPRIAWLLAASEAYSFDPDDSVINWQTDQGLLRSRITRSVPTQPLKGLWPDATILFQPSRQGD